MFIQFKKPLSKIQFLIVLKRFWYYHIRLLPTNKEKVFCIGMNKTGTTTLGTTLKEWQYKMGWQREAERLIKFYYEKNYKPIIDYCNTAEAFQDIPFSLPGMYKELDVRFPDAKFILTVRNNSDQWYSSVVNFMQKVIGSTSIPTAHDLKKHKYHWRGYFWENLVDTFQVTESDPFNRSKLTKKYEQHIFEVKEYFKNSDKLIVINVSKSEDYQRLADFLNKPILHDRFPWENKT